MMLLPIYLITSKHFHIVKAKDLKISEYNVKLLHVTEVDIYLDIVP